ncbi:MAG: arylsulfotransferase family protein [Deltaproteobacteria bacterium]
MVRFVGLVFLFVLSCCLAGLLLAPSWRLTLWAGLSLAVYLLCLVSVRLGSRLHISNEEQLHSLPYASWVPLEKKTAGCSGVIRHDKAKACPGVNIYNSRRVKSVSLLDMQGRVLHTWTAEIDRIGFHHILVTPDGDLWGFLRNGPVFHLGWDSRVKGFIQEKAHHDILPTQGGGICFLAQQYETVWCCGLPIHIANDHVLFYSAAGEKIGDLDLFTCLRRCISPGHAIRMYRHMLGPQRLLWAVRRKMMVDGRPWVFPGDILHTNSLQIIDRDVPGLCPRGAYLVSVCELDLIALIDPEKKQLLWQWGPGQILKQHHAQLLENNHILLFDNGSRETRPYSRVIELDPLSKTIVWEYKADPPEAFFSVTRGGCQRLPNGNTLITDSNKGRVFEVTREGEVVWEFFNPEVNAAKDVRAAIYRMTRITDPENYPAFSKLK